MSFENRACLGNVMKIKELNLRNFRGFQELEIKFPSSNLAVFIGINGSGKSSILDCIAMFFSKLVSDLNKREGEATETYSLTDDDINASSSARITSNIIKLKVHLVQFLATGDYVLPFPESWSIYKKHSLISNNTLQKTDSTESDIKRHNLDYYDRIRRMHTSMNDILYGFVDLPILVYYPTNRILEATYLKLSKSETKDLPFSQHFAYENAFTKNMTNLSDFVSWFRFEEDLENEIKIKQKDFNAVNKNLEIVRRSITTFLNQFPACEFADLHIERMRHDKKISHDGNFSFHPSEESSLVIKKNGQDLKIDQLSAGEQIVLMMVSDIARRLAIANPSLPDPLQGKGIVLIDEIELHLHPQWQRQIIPCLLHTFPNIQFIITTHSPQVLGNVEQEEVFILEDFKIVEKTPHTKGRDSNSVLYELMGLEERPKFYRDKLSQLYRLIDDEKFDEARDILAELTEKFGEHDTEIVRANMHLNLAEEDMNEIHQKG